MIAHEIRVKVKHRTWTDECYLISDDEENVDSAANGAPLESCIRQRTRLQHGVAVKNLDELALFHLKLEWSEHYSNSVGWLLHISIRSSFISVEIIDVYQLNLLERAQFELKKNLIIESTSTSQWSILTCVIWMHMAVVVGWDIIFSIHVPWAEMKLAYLASGQQAMSLAFFLLLFSDWVRDPHPIWPPFGPGKLFDLLPVAIARRTYSLKEQKKTIYFIFKMFQAKIPPSLLFFFFFTLILMIAVAGGFFFSIFFLLGRTWWYVGVDGSKREETNWKMAVALRGWSCCRCGATCHQRWHVFFLNSFIHRILWYHFSLKIIETVH